MNTSLQSIIAALKANNGMAVNDHQSHKPLEERLVKVTVVARVNEDIVMLYDVSRGIPYFSYNAMYVGEDGYAHISRISMGVMRMSEKTLEASVEEHNKLVTVDYLRLADITRL